MLDQIEDVALIFWLLGSATGEPAAVAALHGPRLERLLEEIVDTPVRGFVYEAAGTVPRRSSRARRPRRRRSGAQVADPGRGASMSRPGDEERLARGDARGRTGRLLASAVATAAASGACCWSARLGPGCARLDLVGRLVELVDEDDRARLTTTASDREEDPVHGRLAGDARAVAASPITSRRLSSPSASVFDCSLARQALLRRLLLDHRVGDRSRGRSVALILASLFAVVGRARSGLVPRRRAALVVALRSLTHPVTT